MSVKNMTDKQISIISAAIEIFSEKGYAASTTSEIAKRAKVGEGTVFHHFKTKKDLLLAIPEYLDKSSLSKALLLDINTIIEDPRKNFEDFLRTIIQNRSQFASANLPLLKVLFQEISFHPELREKISQIILLPAVGKLTEAIDHFKKQGQIVDIPSVSVVNLIFTTIFGYFFTRNIAMLDLKWDSEHETEYLVSYIMKGLSSHILEIN